MKEQGLKETTIRAILRIVNQMIHSAIEKKQMKENPFLLIKMKKVRKLKVAALTKNEQKHLKKTALAEEKGRGIPVLLALYAGLRIGEISALTWRDIDFETNQIHINSTFQRVLSQNEDQKTSLIFSGSKTASSVRSIPLGRMLRKILLQHKQRTKGAFVCSEKNHPSEPRLLTYHYHQIREKAGLQDIHFHQLRHTFATRCVESSGDIVSISAMMGHSSSKMTLDIYADSLVEQRIQVMNQMEKAIS